MHSSWQIANANGVNRHSLNHLDPLTPRIILEVENPIRKALHGIALYDQDQPLIWSKAPFHDVSEDWPGPRLWYQTVN
jgi:hypothetical protein